MSDELHKRIGQMQAEHPDVYRDPEDLVIYLFYKSYYTDECGFSDIWDGDCQHPRGWHSVPFRVVKNAYRYRFETIRRRPDGEPGTDWTPMSPEEVEDVQHMWLSERLAQLSRAPKIKEPDDA